MTAHDSRARPAVMADVASRAGVSHMTVSRVLNGSPSVSDPTRQRVLAAMAELDYRPNVAARALVTGRSRIVGVISFDTTLYGPASTLFGIERAARAAGYFVSISSVGALDLRSISDAVDNLRAQAAAGIIVIAPYASTAEALGDLSVDVPMVAVEGGAPGPLPAVAVDQYGGARAAVEHLLALGHDTVRHVAGSLDWLEARAREDGWRATLEDAGAAVPELLVGDWSARSGFELGRRIMTEGGTTAIFAGNDSMALGVLRALHEAGVDVPGQVSVVGFDDVPEAAYLTPPLTTVRQDFAEVGRRSLQVLVEQMESSGEVEEMQVVVGAELVVRASSGPAPGRAGGGHQRRRK